MRFRTERALGVNGSLESRPCDGNHCSQWLSFVNTLRRLEVIAALAFCWAVLRRFTELEIEDDTATLLTGRRANDTTAKLLLLSKLWI